METLQKLTKLKECLHSQIKQYKEEIDDLSKSHDAEDIKLLKYYKEVKEEKVIEYGNVIRAIKQFSKAVEKANVTIRSAEEEIAKVLTRYHKPLF